jgi:4-hydroxy-3-polyprenylbenzoate decarboxylase
MPLATDDLREWIKTLEKHGELRRIREEVSPELEITEITDRVSKTGVRGQGSGIKGPANASETKYAPGGPALLFENVKGHPGHKVLINQFGSERRMALALGVDRLDEIAERISGLMSVKAPEGLLDKLKMLPQLGALTSAFPKTVAAKDAPCKEMIRRERFDLNYFPILKCWPQDGGRFITLPCVHTRDPRTGKRNIGMYRMQVYDGQTTGMHWQRQKVAAEHYREALRNAAAASADPTQSAEAARVAIMAESAGGAVTIPDGPLAGTPQVSVGALKGSRLEVAVAIGTDPATTFAAVVPAPPEVEEFLIAGFLRGKPVEIVKCETVDLEVPANAEIVLEGYVELGELRREGHLHHPSQGPHLRRDHRGQAAHGGFVDGPSRRQHLSARDEDDHSRACGHSSTRRGRLPQSDDRVDQKKLSRPCAQGDARHLVAGPGHVHQVHHRG